MSKLEALMVLATFIGGFAGGITGALAGRLRETRREIDSHKRDCQHYRPTLTPAPHER